MAHKPKIDQNFAPSKDTLRGISSQAITRRQIKLESCSNPLKTREGMYFAIKKTFHFKICGFLKCLYNDRMFMLFLLTSAFLPNLPLRYAGAI